eukprot:gene4680-5290_t
MRILCSVVLATAFLFHEQYAAFTGNECLDQHNIFREKHDNTPALKYSKELETSAQTYADKLANDDTSNPVPTKNLPKRRKRAVVPTTDPYFHKEMWDGEILFPPSNWDLNKGRKVAIGESIHKFCCYSFPYCPSVFFHGLNFPPSAKGVVGHWYKEVNNYDFQKGSKKYPGEEIKHFTNIVWKKTTEVGCAQSKKTKKGCIYTVARYRVQGSVGGEDDYKTNVGTTTPVPGSKKVSNQSYLMIFLIVLFVLLVLVIVIITYIKRNQLKALYAEYQMKRSAKKAEASLRDDYDEESFNGKKSLIYRPSSKKSRPSIRVIQNTSPASTLPMKPRNPTQGSADRMSILYRRSNEECSIVTTIKPLPPRPTSPVKAEAPQHIYENVSLRGNRPPPRPTSRAPPPPTKPVTEEAPASQEEPRFKNGSVEDDTKTGKPIVSSQPVAPCKVAFQPTCGDKQSGTAVQKPLVPPTKPAPTGNKNPIPAPRPGKARPVTEQQFEPRPPPSRTPVNRASRKNPNFRTLPVNDRASVKTHAKISEEESSKVDWRSQLKKTNANGEDKTRTDTSQQQQQQQGKPKPLLPPQGKKPPLATSQSKPEPAVTAKSKPVPLVPPGGKPVPQKRPASKDFNNKKDNPQSKPLLPTKAKLGTDNEVENNDRPVSVLERRRLLENGSNR